MLTYIITLITVFRSDTSIYISWGRGKQRENKKEKTKKQKHKKREREGVYCLATTRKSIRALLIFSNCLERLNLAFTEDFSHFPETFH